MGIKYEKLGPSVSDPYRGMTVLYRRGPRGRPVVSKVLTPKEAEEMQRKRRALEKAWRERDPENDL